MIIALTGEKLAGKGTTAEYFATQYSAKVIRFSQVLVDILQRLHRQPTRAELVTLGQGLRTLYGDDVLAHVVRDDIQQHPQAIWVIDGLRFLREYDLFSKLPQFYVLNISADLATRYQRTRQRGEKSDEMTMSLAEFEQREHDLTEQEIPVVQERADDTIDNTGSVAELYQAIDQWYVQVA